MKKGCLGKSRRAAKIRKGIGYLKRSRMLLRQDLAVFMQAERQVVHHTPRGDQGAVRHLADMTRSIDRITQTIKEYENV